MFSFSEMIVLDETEMFFLPFEIFLWIAQGAGTHYEVSQPGMR